MNEQMWRYTPLNTAPCFHKLISNRCLRWSPYWTCQKWEWRSSFLHMWSCCPNLPAANNTCSKQTLCGLVIAVTEAKLLPFEKTHIQQSTTTRVLIPFEFCHDYFFPLKRVSLCHKTTQVCEMQICKGYTANSRISDMVSLDIRQNPKHLVEWFCISAAHTTD